jgi:hypothetical protein
MTMDMGRRRRREKGVGEKQPSVVVVAGRPGIRPLMERTVVKPVVGYWRRWKKKNLQMRERGGATTI